jgi:hypothetical protein
MYLNIFMKNMSLLMKETLMLHRFSRNVFAVSVLMLKRLDSNRELAVMTCYVEAMQLCG